MHSHFEHHTEASLRVSIAGDVSRQCLGRFARVPQEGIES